MEERKSHLLALAVVAVIGMGALVLMFSQASTTGQVTKLKSSLVPMGSCNYGELVVSSRTVQAFSKAGKQFYGPEFSAYSDGGCWLREGVGYCCPETKLKEVFG